MKHTRFPRLLSLLLACLMLVGCMAELVACTNDEGSDTSASEQNTAEVTSEVEDDPFKDVDYKGRPFRVLTSTNAASSGMGNSNFLIEGEKDAVTNIVNDAVATRNSVVENKIGVTLEFTQLDVDYNGVEDKIRTYASAGIDEFDLVINDIYPFANLSIQGNFRNVLDPEFTSFDFDDKSYWYKEYMDDMCLVEGYEYILAGDFFIDILRSAHLLLFNKNMYQNTHENADPNEVYEWVLNYEWTYEKMLEMIQGVYQDKNNNGEKDYGDIYGFSILELWGSSIGFVVSADPGFVSRDEDGSLTITLGETSRAADLTDYLTKLAYDENACFGLTSDAQILQDFTNGLSLICDYQRLGSLENAVLKDMADSFGVLPCPMLYASDQKYNTATHDTTEVGAILQTCQDPEFVSTVIQVLNRETSTELMPKYYGEALQVQYVTDPYASKMIQIIHDNISVSFILAYNNQLGSTVLNTFSNAVAGKRTFEVVYKSIGKQIPRKMKSMINTFEKKNHISD